ncbi:DnaJ domain-containing protein [Pyronema domesticum]|nr:DnaJ domain-containing protein [Pyronema domesticum]
MPALRTIANSISNVYKTRISTPTAGCVLVRRGFSSTPRTGFTETSWRGFTETKRWGMKHPREEMRSHYETLGVPEGASRADIKKRFYALSKTHHPDLNRNDPEASKKFISISNAYSILGNPKLREKYDKELFRARPASHASPVGARPASGLSRRRTQPMGPPPSFYRNGAWNTMKSSSTTGSYGSAQARATAQAASEAWAKGHAAANQATGGGMGYTAGHGAGGGRVHGFNFEGKVRQHERQEERVRLRGKKNATGDRKVVVPFLVVSGILALSVWVSGIGREKGTKAAIQGGEVWNR